MLLNQTGIEIGEIGFGGMPLSTKGRPSEEQSRRVLNAAIDAGMTFIDTADVYCIDDSDIGHNERLIASVVRERPDRDRIHIATKAGFRRPHGDWTHDGSPQHIREACEQSLRSLGTDSIDLYQLHAVDPRFGLEKSVETFAELQREGKCRHVGLSNVSVLQIAAAQKIVKIVSVQNRLNPYFREAIEDSVVDYCADNNITFLAYSPVGGGRLAKKLPKFPLMQSLAEKYNATPHAVTLAWVRSKGSTVVRIPGARKEEHARDSANAARLQLAAEDVEAIDGEAFPTT
jgi:aryl-alcohol dehydrogenase-like predicted oxidoreductase